MDKRQEYASTDIINPNQCSYVNLFINGIIQPATFYQVDEGRLTLLHASGSVPEKGVPIILQFIKITGRF
ncbi:DUF4183 domain-containing protein [Fictibacillus nanhaiensis]|nr:DUF4183 domain-containing protein [Fictibacillus nanhaiensis]